MKARKIATLALTLCLIGGAAGTAGVLTTFADEEKALSTENAALFLPESYEEYLPLNAPSYIAVCAEHTAIADGNRLYIYDRAGEVYKVYRHVLGYDETPVPISKAQFTKDGELYFRDDLSNLYRYDYESGEAQIVDNMSCLTFLIHDDYLYMANASNTAGRVNFTYIRLDELDDINAIHRLTQEPLDARDPLLAFEGDTLYCIVSNNTVYAYSEETHAYLSSLSGTLDSSMPQIADLKFVCAYEGSLFYSVNGLGNPANGLYQTDIHGNAKRVIEGDGFSSITSYGGKLYCMQGKSVRELLVTEDGISFTDFEIASSSSSQNRLANAVDTVRAGSLLVTADAGNNRVSVYDFTKREYTVIPCDFTPTLVATDGETIAVASINEIYTFSYGESETGEAVYSAEKGAQIRGVACVYGGVYYVTDNNEHGKVGGDKISRGYYGTPKWLACDIYGDLFVAYESGKVYSYSEENFVTIDANENIPLFTLPEDAACLRADFMGNLYYLSQGAVYMWEAERAAAEVLCKVDGNNFVYHEGEERVSPVSFALGFEDDEVYFLFGNYVVKSNAGTLEEIPTLSEIEVNGAREEALSPHTPENLLVTVKQDKVGIHVDLDKLKEEDPQYFPYVDYYRNRGEKQGVVIGRTGETDQDFALVLIFEEDRSYSVNLFRNSSLTFIPEEDYFTADTGAFYLTNEVGAYFAPALHGAIQNERLSGGTQVTVLGYIQAADYRYALIAPMEEARGEANAGYFLPASFLTVVNPYGGEANKFITGAVKANEAGIEFTSADGETVTVTDRTNVLLYENEDGTYTAVLEKDNVQYYATVTKDELDWGETDALRISLIVILSVLAGVIIGLYLYFISRTRKVELPKDNKPNKQKEKEEKIQS